MAEVHASIEPNLNQLVNVALTMASALAQYQQVGYAFHVWMLAMGATVEASSNGVDIPDTNDNITSAASIKHGTPTSEAHSWVIYTITDGVRSVWFKVEFADADAVTTPRTLHIYRSQGAYDVGGILSNVTAPSTVSADRESATLTMYILPWGTGPVAGTINYQWSAAENIGWFMAKQDGSDNDVSGVLIDRAAADDDFADGRRDWLIMTTGTLSFFGWENCYATSAGGASSVGGYDGTAGSTIPAWATAGLVVWTNGLPADGRVRLYAVKWMANVVDQEDRRVCGVSRIFRRPAAYTGTNDTDPQDPVGEPWEWRVIARGAFLWKKTDGAIT